MRGNRQMVDGEAVNFFYDIDACGCIYGRAAYEHMVDVVGPELLRDVAIYSGDDSATLAGYGRTYVVSVVGSRNRIVEIVAKLRATPLGSPLRRVTSGLGILRAEPLVCQGGIDAGGVCYNAHDGSMIEVVRPMLREAV